MISFKYDSNPNKPPSPPPRRQEQQPDRWICPRDEARNSREQGNARPLPPHIGLAEAYVPIQPYGRTFALEEAMHKGTIYPDLYQPYQGHYWEKR